MKTIFGSALAIPLAMAFSLTRSSAEETQSGDMRLYPPTTIEWKAGANAFASWRKDGCARRVIQLKKAPL